ncbi:hypothetical protein RND81_14G225300 [Saponaria officinalis]|uniref:Uncharacterized protein n=1 Tax=Saponaria officinalis TaxID=3572 RepID=A0AAW1GT83_SAPOF
MVALLAYEPESKSATVTFNSFGLYSQIILRRENKSTAKETKKYISAHSRVKSVVACTWKLADNSGDGEYQFPKDDSLLQKILSSYTFLQHRELERKPPRMTFPPPTERTTLDLEL